MTPSITAHNAEPVTAVNAPFQTRIRYRADDYGSLRHQLLTHLEETFPTWNPELAGNEGTQDLGVAFIEMFAYLGDILGFYQDCRANEIFLRTALLPASCIELCALIDYRPAPGASASTLQVFLLKPAQKGRIPAAFKVKTKAQGARPELIFETLRDLDADAARNQLRLAGFNRSLRKLNATGQARDTSLLLDRGYDGLKAGDFAVFNVPGGPVHPVRITAVTEEGTTRRIRWKPESIPISANLALADLVILGKPKQAMTLAARERADEITAGQNAARVVSPGILSLHDHLLFVQDGFRQVARVIDKSGSVITWNRGFPISLRRSATKIYTAGHDGFAVASSAIRPGAHSFTSDNNYQPKPVPGDYIIISSSAGLELVLVTSVSANTYTLADPVTRAHPSATLFKVRLDNQVTGAAGSPHTTLSPPRLNAGDTVLILDKAYEGLEPGTWLVLSDGSHTAARRCAAVELDAQDRTQLTLETSVGDTYNIATLQIHGPFAHQMRAAGFDRAENETPTGLGALTFHGLVDGLKPGDYLCIEGGGHHEGARISALTVSQGHTVAAIEEPLAHAYPVGDSVVFGNVAPVSHGESVIEEALGSGDQSKTGQRFTLHRSPTTHVADPEGRRGVSSTLRVFVDDEQWTEVESLAESDAEDRHYMIEIDDQEVSSVVFGDGRHGARLPTGRNNVKVRYRVTHGSQGNVDAEAIATPAQPPPFLASTRNPMPAAGGADRETPEETRRLAPVTAQTLDRAVSLSDYTALALAHAGIAKARADWDREDRRRMIQLTVATVGGRPLTYGLKNALRGFLEARRTPRYALRVRDYQPLPVRLSLEIHVHDRFLRSETKLRVTQALGAGITESGEKGYFHFDRRGLGEDLHLSDIYKIVEEVPGVDFVVAREFHPEGTGNTGVVLDRIPVPAGGLATGGDPADVSRGILHIEALGGIA